MERYGNRVTVPAKLNSYEWDNTFPKGSHRRVQSPRLRKSRFRSEPARAAKQFASVDSPVREKGESQCNQFCQQYLDRATHCVRRTDRRPKVLNSSIAQPCTGGPYHYRRDGWPDLIRKLTGAAV